MTGSAQGKLHTVTERFLFPVLLALYPLVGWNAGVDVADTTYAMSGYLHPERLTGMWRFAFYLSNAVGYAFTKLPKGETLAGMNLYTTCVISVTALVAYFFLTRRVGVPAWIAFLGEVIAVALCWCPRVILYNYLTYLLLTVGVCLLLGALGDRGTVLLSPVKFLLAGVCFGLNVHVRFPNVVQAALIVLVWADAYWKKERVSDALKKTGVCVLGYCVGFGVPYLWIVAHYGAGAYAQMVSSLFGMTAGAQDYAAEGMLMSILGTYGRSVMKMWPLWVAIAVGVVVGRLIGDKVTAVLCVVALFVMYKQEVFTRSYYYYDSVFEVAMMFLILGVIVCVWRVVGGAKDSSHLLGMTGVSAQVLALTAVLLIVITPLGSNNYTYPVLNNLFLIAPMVLWVTMTGSGSPSVIRTIRTALGCVTLLLLVQGMMFKSRYAFNDGTDGTPRDTVIADIPRAAGMRTTAENAAALTSLYDTMEGYRNTEAEWKEAGMEPWGVVSFGTAPGILYLMELEPAMDVTWPDLDSVPLIEFEQALRTMDGFPLIVVRKNPFTGEAQWTGQALGEAKWTLLQEYMERKVYMKYEPGDNPAWMRTYDVYVSPASSRVYFMDE